MWHKCCLRICLTEATGSEQLSQIINNKNRHTQCAWSECWRIYHISISPSLRHCNPHSWCWHAVPRPPQHPWGLVHECVFFFFFFSLYLCGKSYFPFPTVLIFTRLTKKKKKHEKNERRKFNLKRKGRRRKEAELGDERGGAGGDRGETKIGDASFHMTSGDVMKMDGRPRWSAWPFPKCHMSPCFYVTPRKTICQGHKKSLRPLWIMLLQRTAKK